MVSDGGWRGIGGVGSSNDATAGTASPFFGIIGIVSIAGADLLMGLLAHLRAALRPYVRTAFQH